MKVFRHNSYSNRFIQKSIFQSYVVGDVPFTKESHNYLRKYFAAQLESLVANEPDALEYLVMSDETCFKSSDGKRGHRSCEYSIAEKPYD